MTDATLKIQAVAQFSSRGLHAHQEDHQLAVPEKGIFCVADGFGGEFAGKDAAKSACEAVKSFLQKEAGDLDATLPFVLRNYYSLAGNVLFNALVHANRQLIQNNHKKNVHEKGGASVIATFMDGPLLAIANAGVCSAWLLRGDEVRELVVPRSYARLRSPFGTDPAGVHGLGWDVPLVALGMTDDFEPEVVEYRVEEGDWVVLSTDGVSKTEVIEILKIKQLGLNLDSSLDGIKEALKNQEFMDQASATVLIY